MALDRDLLGLTSEPLGREDEALLAAVDVSSLDKQEGYDVSLLALQPRDVRPSSSSSPPADPHASFRSHDSPPLPDTLRDPTTAAYQSGVPSSFSYPSHDDESAPLDPSSTSRTSSDHRRFRQSAVPPLSASNPRRAAQAYSERARAAERQRRGGGGALEKGGSARAGGGRRALWQRKGLVVGLVLVILLVCAGIGIGLGVTLSGRGGGAGGEKGDGLEAVSAATATASASSADVAHEPQPSMAPTMMPTAAPSIVAAEEDSAVPVPAPTHSAGETAPVPVLTGAAASSVPSWEAEESWSDGTEG